MGLLSFNPGNFSDALAGLSQGLLAYGSGNPQGLLTVPAVVARSRQDRLQNTRQQQLLDMEQQKFGLEKTKLEQEQAQAAQSQAARDAFKKAHPEYAPYIDAFGNDAVSTILGQAFPKPEQQHKIGDTRDYLKGNQKVTDEWNGQAWVPLGSGPAFSPQQDNGAFGMVPIYGKDAQGNTILLQLGKNGQINQPPLPAGVSIAPQTQFLDTGTGYVGMDKRGGGVVGNVVPKDVAGEAAAKAAGTATGEAQVNLPSVETNAGIIKQTISQLRSAPGRATGTGLSSVLDPRNYIAGTDAADFKAKREQLAGQTFLQAYQSLKGGGQITEIEGAKAQNALARLQTAQSDGEFVNALNDFETEVDKLVDVARKKASGNLNSNAGASDPLGLR